MKRMLTVVLLAACAIGTMSASAAPSEVAVSPSVESVHAADLGAFGVLGAKHELQEQMLPMPMPAFAGGVPCASLARTGQRAGASDVEKETPKPASMASEAPWRPLRCPA